MKQIILVFSVILQIQFAHGKDFGMAPVELRRGQLAEGQLFSVKYTPGAKKVSFTIIGKQKDISLAGLKPQLIFSSSKQSIPLKYENDAFVYPDNLPSNSVLEIRNEKGEIESFQIKDKP